MNPISYWRNVVQKRFSGLNARDQKALLLLMIFMVSTAFYFGMWQPVERGRERSEASFLQARAEYEWMNAHAGDVKQPATSNSTLPAGVLLETATNAAQPYNIIISHAEPADDGSLHLSIESVPFGHLIVWLNSMKQQQGVNVSQITLQELEQVPGQVSAQIILRRR